MAILATSGLTLPKNIASGLWKKAIGGSTVAALSGSEPQQFGEVSYMTFNTRPRAEFVGEGADKAGSSVGFGVKTAVPRKAQVTLRFNEEVLWADEDYQLGVLTECADASGDALARALDFGVYHSINPLTGAAVVAMTENVNDTTNRVEITTASAPNPDLDIEAAAGLVIADGFQPNGIALDPAFGWKLATARYADGRKKYPDLGLTADVTSFEGFRASTSSTVSGTPEAADQKVRAILGDFSTIRWGVQRRVPVELIRFGDPDGQGDLKRKNQIALRTEVVYGWAFMDLNAFAVIEDTVANV